MMSNQFLAFTLTLLGCLLVSLPQPATAFTVKLLGVGDSYGEGHIKSSDNKRPIPHGGDVFPDPNGNETHEMNTDEMSLDILRGTMSNAEIDTYLVRFGYLVPSAKGLISLEVRKEAIKEFQSFANLKPTGVLDLKTIKKMKTPRCGMADPVSNSEFANFDAKGSRKWDTKRLTYRIIEYSKKLSKSIVREYVAKAFKMWSDVSQLDFIEVSSGPSDLKIRFSPKNHGDGNPFDGAGGVLGHAFYPQSGEIHMDEVENWTIKTRNGINLLFVLVHEIGHAIGLGHSKVDDAIMGPFYDGYDPNLKLQQDDIAGIQYLYGKPITSTPKTEAPTTQAPTTQAPTTQAPTTQAPTTQAPTTQAPTTTTSTTEVPTTKSSSTQAPNSKVPTTEALTTKTPTTVVQTSTASATTVSTTGAWTTSPSTTDFRTSENPQTNYPTTEETGPYEPKPPKRRFPCPFRFWATMAAGNRTYGFIGRNVYEILSSGRIGRRTPIRAIFRRGPRYVGAAAYNEASGHTFFFLRRIVYRFTDHKLDPGFPKRLRFFIRAAVVVDGQLMAFSFNHIHYLDEDTMEDFADGEVSIQDEFPGLPKAVRAAVSYDDGYAYMLYRNKVVLLDIYTGEMTEESCYRH